MEKLPLLRVVEVAFTTKSVQKSVNFYTTLGLKFPSKLERLNFAEVGEQLFGVCDAREGFGDGMGGYVRTKLHVAFEVPSERLDECIAFLKRKRIKVSPKREFRNWHEARRSLSVYFRDPAGNIMELWAPLNNRC